MKTTTTSRSNPPSVIRHPSSAIRHSRSIAPVSTRSRQSRQTMLSAGMQHQSGRSGYGHLGNGDMMLQHDRNAQSSSQRQHLTGLDALAQGSQYALQQLHNDAMSSSKRPQEPYSAMDHVRAQQDQGIAQGHGKPASGPPRRRISRACDQCNQLRTKCDGKSPCAHCVGRLNLCSTPS